MLSKERFRAIGVIVLSVAVFGGLLYQGLAGATAASFTDPTGDATGTGGIDIVAISHDDDGSNFTYRVDTAAPFDNNLISKIEWDLSLDNNTTLREGTDACITVEGDGSGGLIAALNDCGSEILGSATATKATEGSGERVTVVFPNSVIRAAGGLGAGSAYKYKVRSDVFGATDDAPDTGLVDHTGLAPVATATPIPTATPTATPTIAPGAVTATDNQTVLANVQGVLSINAVQASVDFGNIATAETKVAPVGQIDYTNTLNDGLSWSVSVKATSLVSGANNVPFTNMSFTPGSTVTSAPGSSGTPTTGASGAFVGTDTTPGTTFSNPVTIATAPPTTQGSFQQTGSTLQLAVPLSSKPGAYTGTLQYTIVG